MVNKEPGYVYILTNPSFNSIEFEGFRKEAGLKLFSFTPKECHALTE